MKIYQPFHDAHLIHEYVQRIHAEASQPWTLMEICGGQTHSILQYGLDQLLAGAIELVHGPGCPVCVTPESIIDAAIELAMRPQTILCTYGDMLRVPGSRQSLAEAKAKGATVRLVTNPMDVLRWAKEQASSQFVFLAVGFETTAPAHAMLVYYARKQALKNIQILVAHRLVPPAVSHIFSTESCSIQGLLAAGHVCSISGAGPYRKLSQHWQKPIIITGFEPVDILNSILAAVRQLERGQHHLTNTYSRVARAEGNPIAQDLVDEVFMTTACEWRGLGFLPASGLALRNRYDDFDASALLEAQAVPDHSACDCRAADILTGRIKPKACPHFAESCTPSHPMGAPMVSAEGACAAYMRYQFQSEVC